MTFIIKASGENALFDPARLYRSLKRVGTNETLIQEIVDEVTHFLSDGMTTHEIYRIAFQLLRKKSKMSAAKYHLKRAIMQLGISGYPFEKFVAAILQHQGFEVLNNQIINGYCVNHEVDVIAKRDDLTKFIECKYHNRLGIKCDVKISLYFKARLNDIEQCYKKNPGEQVQGWIVTNTRFSTDALQYGRCAGLHLMSWDYPEKGSLKEQIELSGLYPLTCITNFTPSEILQLLNSNIILCKTISENPSLLQKLHITELRLNRILEQCHKLCNKKQSGSL